MNLKFKKMPLQRNHDSCTLPQGLEAMVGNPLYILVAEWCRRQGRWLSRNDIALAFEISPQRASYQLSYLTKRPEIICCEVKQVRAPGSPSEHYEIRVHKIDLLQLHARRPPVYARESPRRGAQRSRVGNADKSIRDSLKLLWPVRPKGKKE